MPRNLNRTTYRVQKLTIFVSSKKKRKIKEEGEKRGNLGKISTSFFRRRERWRDFKNKNKNSFQI